jgi:uncharacterized protein YndB with AHSA1/START domain
MKTTVQAQEITGTREIVMSRMFDAPRERVWQAWTDAKQIVQWWGPDGFTNTLYEIDVRSGGVWRHMMHGPDGTDYPNRVVYKEVVKPERLVYWHGGDDKASSCQFHVTVRFEDVGGKTKLTMTMLFETAEQREETVKFGVVEGGNQTLARLAEHLKKN